MQKVLAIDMGATSIRGIISYIDDKKLHTEEVMRFKHDFSEVEGRMRWDWDLIISNIVDVIEKYGDEIVSVGIDTWGVDFGLINGDGTLVSNPISYRDPKHMEGYNSIFSKKEPRDVFLETGNQIMPINTLFQLEAFKMFHKDDYERSKTLLMIPDLINYYLCGEISSERTISSTTQMYDIGKGDWNYELIESLGLNADLLPAISHNNGVLGSTKNSKIERLRKFDIKVVQVAAHDTASAIAMTEAYSNPDNLFLSSGTWSLIGCTTDKPIIDELSYEYNLTNETGYENRNMYFKNVNGLYSFEKLKQELEEIENTEIDFDTINEHIAKTKPLCRFIDVNNAAFASEDPRIINHIEDYLKETNQPIAEDKYEYFRMIYESLVLEYIDVVESISKSIDHEFKAINIIGGGAKSEVLCQMISDGLSIPASSGPYEATALGNIMAQFIAVDAADEELIIKRIKESYETVLFLPMKEDNWENARNYFKRIK